MKKFISIFSVIMIFILLFSGCTQETEKEPENTPSPEPTTTPAPTPSNEPTNTPEPPENPENPVDSSVLKGKKLTMINIWATYCGPCINEMPFLGEISKEYADKDFQIIGIALDVVDYYTGGLSESQISLAKDIINRTGADYLHLVPSESLYNAKLSQVTSIPETIFVDENGCQVGESVIGGRSKEAWIEIIENRLEQVQ